MTIRPQRLRRPRTLRRAALALVLATAATTGLVVTTSANAEDPTVPPWQTGTGTSFAKSDPHKVGTLKFFDATGTEIFGGSTTAAPFAAYVQASNAITAGDTNANLYAYTPSSGSYPGDWSGTLLASGAQFPVATPPGSVSATLPVLKGTAADTKLSAFVAQFPNSSADAGYAGVYELRLRTSKPNGEVGSADYAVADIEVTGTSWQVFGAKEASSITETVPASASYGAGFSVPVTVTPGTAAGTVALKEGTTTVATGTVTAGTGTVNVSGTALAGGTHSLVAVYSGSGALNGSSSTASPITINPIDTTTTSTVPVTATYGTAFSVTATVSGPAAPGGTATLKEGATTISTVNVVGSTATFPVAGTRFAPGSHSLVVTYNGSTSLNPSSSVAKAVVVGKAVGRATNALTPKTIRHTRRAKLTVRVTAVGVYPTGLVTIYDGSKVIARVTLTAAKKGVAVVTLPRLKRGRHSIHAYYGGSGLVGAATAARVVLKST
ncbi:MAG: Ig-like domain-containing protein [Marmoricola sp.]